MFYNFQKNNFESKYKKLPFLSLFMNQIFLLMKNYSSTLLLVLSLSILVACTKNKSEETVRSEEENALAPPLPQANIAFENYSISPTKDTVIHHQSGAVITIPKNAFLDENGNIVTKPVAIKFRTFSNPLETYLAGIPMEITDQDGNTQVFESAGMFEINASLKGKNLKVNPENKIKVGLPSYTADTKFNTYDLDSSSNTWKLTGKDNVKVINESDELDALPEVPKAPKIATKFSFQVFDKLNKNDKLEMYKDVWFDPIDGKKCGFDFAKDIIVENLNNGTYQVTFVPWNKIPDTLKTKCICTLSFKDNTSYNKALKAYKRKYASLLNKVEKEKAIIEKRWAIYREKRRVYQAYFLNKNMDKLNESQKIMRTLEVSNFGIVNLDWPEDYPQGANVAPIFVDEDGNALTLKNVILIEKGKNAVYRYPNTIYFNPNEENTLIGITANGLLAYYTTNDFKSLPSTKEKVVFKMRVHPVPLQSYEEIVKVIFSKS